MPGSRGPAQVPITPCPCSAARSRSSAHVLLDDVGDRAVQQHVEGLGIEQLGELGPVRRRAHPGVAARRCAAPTRMRSNSASYAQVALDVGRGERGDRGGGALGVGPAATDVPSGNGHHRLGSSRTTSNPWRRRSSSSTTSGCSSPTTYAHGLTRYPGVGERRVERGGAAELLAGLQHEHRTAGPGEVGGGGEPVVAAADHAPRPRCRAASSARASGRPTRPSTSWAPTARRYPGPSRSLNAASET